MYQALLALVEMALQEFGPQLVHDLAQLLKGQKAAPLTTEQALALESLSADAAALAIAAKKG